MGKIFFTKNTNNFIPFLHAMGEVFLCTNAGPQEFFYDTLCLKNIEAPKMFSVEVLHVIKSLRFVNFAVYRKNFNRQRVKPRMYLG